MGKAMDREKEFGDRDRHEPAKSGHEQDSKQKLNRDSHRLDASLGAIRRVDTTERNTWHLTFVCSIMLPCMNTLKIWIFSQSVTRVIY